MREEETALPGAKACPQRFPSLIPCSLARLSQPPWPSSFPRHGPAWGSHSCKSCLHSVASLPLASPRIWTVPHSSLTLPLSTYSQCFPLFQSKMFLRLLSCFLSCFPAYPPSKWGTAISVTLILYSYSVQVSLSFSPERKRLSLFPGTDFADTGQNLPRFYTTLGNALDSHRESHLPRAKCSESPRIVEPINEITS